MIPREVTIGRAPDNDIQCGANCMTVSNHHALIYSNGNRLMYEDTSTNGTLINNVLVHKSTMALRYGDTILLAGRVPLRWEKICMFFPADELRRASAGTQNAPSRTSTEMYVETSYAGNNPLEDSSASAPSGKYSTDVEITRFNWGAFFLYPLWGFANGMWWLFFLSIIIGLFWPIPNIVFGIMGSKWAWRSKQWRNIEHFVSVQRSWKRWGIGLFIAGLVIMFLWFIVAVALVSALANF